MDRFFYAPPEAFSSDGYVTFPPDEARHVVKVLRLHPGAIVTVVNGRGLGAKVKIDQSNRHGVCGKILSTHENLGEPVRDLTIGLALLKLKRRYALFLEKAVEVGVTRIVPLITERSEQKFWRPERAIQVMIAALKQSNRSKLPDLRAPTPLEQALIPGALMADPSADKLLMDSIGQGTDPVMILIGPEGGFTDNERNLAVKNGVTLTRLGPRRLRSETAAICSAAAVMLRSSNGTQGAMNP